MTTDFIETVKGEIHSFLKTNFRETKFTVKFNGEFFIARANGQLPEGVLFCGLDAVSGYEIKGNAVVFSISDQWLEHVLPNIPEAQCGETDLSVYSQIKRLDKHLEFGLFGGKWDESMYFLAKEILYFLHTKSSSIRSNIVKKCAQEYNVIQRRGRIPEELIRGYRNALCLISDKI